MMKKTALWIVTIVLCLLTFFALASCERPTENTGTLGEQKIEKDDRVEFLKLKDIEFPEGMLETGLGLYIWDPTNKDWVRTDTSEGKALFRKDKSTFIFAHGMGGNATVDCPDYYYENGYNPLSFKWGAFSDELDESWMLIADKIWYREYGHWRRSDDTFEEFDLSNASATEIYAAFYYDLFEAFPDYSGSEIIMSGHSYGGMLTGAMTSFICSMYKKGHMPAYMLPDKVVFLDPYFSRADLLTVPWLLKEEQPVDGNVNECLYRASNDCKDLGIAVGLIRTSKMVCTTTTMNHFGLDLTGSYWKFCNNIVYAHINDNWQKEFIKYAGMIHGYGWSWFDEYNTGYVLKDSSATVEEEALCFYMPYEKMFAKSGIKYDFDINETWKNIEDDIVTSFFCTYDPYVNDAYTNETETILNNYKEGKAKIAGFAYVDNNGNGKMDERIKDHFAGVTVTVKNADGETIYNGKTGNNGYYEVETNIAGEYTVSFTAPKGFTVSAEEVKVNIQDTQRQVAINNVAVARS